MVVQVVCDGLLRLLVAKMSWLGGRLLLAFVLASLTEGVGLQTETTFYQAPSSLVVRYEDAAFSLSRASMLPACGLICKASTNFSRC